MGPTRRELLTGAAAAAAAALLPTGCGDRSVPPRHFVLVTAYGGWDTTWTFDPKPDNPGIDVPAGHTRWFGDIPLWTDSTRPVAKQFFGKYAHRCAVVNGVNVGSIAHSQCMQRMLTGTAAPHAPDLAAIVGFELGADRPMPYLVLGDMSYPGTLESSTGRVGPSNQLATLARPPSSWHPDTDDEGAIRAFVEARVARERALRGSVSENQSRMDDFLKSLGKSDQLLQRAADLGGTELIMGMDTQRALAIRALQTGLSSAVSMSAGVTFDTHVDNVDQGPLHEQLFTNLQSLLDDLDAQPGVDGGATMLDETLVMVVTEMGRTPLLNAAAGKDHWPWASAMLFGAGLQTGRVYGATDDTFQGVPVDFFSGEPSASGQLVEHSHLAAGVLWCMGIDPGRWFPGTRPLEALLPRG